MVMFYLCNIAGKLSQHGSKILEEVLSDVPTSLFYGTCQTFVVLWLQKNICSCFWEIFVAILQQDLITASEWWLGDIQYSRIFIYTPLYLWSVNDK